MPEIKHAFTCYHCHDYSTIELNGEDYLEIHNDDTMSEDEYEGTVAKVEKIVELLNKDNN